MDPIRDRPCDGPRVKRKPARNVHALVGDKHATKEKSIMRKFIVLLALAAFAALSFSSGDALADGKMFTDMKCNKCHSVKALKIEPIKAKKDITDLSKTGASHDAKWFDGWLQKTIEMDSAVKKGKKVKHKAKFKGDDKQRAAMVKWLLTLK